MAHPSVHALSEPMAKPDLCEAELVAVLVGMDHGVPTVLTLCNGEIFPAGPLTMEHRSLQKGMRGWVERQTGMALGHTEQLYTFASAADGKTPRQVRISYLAFIRQNYEAEETATSLYEYFPWEDRRHPACHNLLLEIKEQLKSWAGAKSSHWQRCCRIFGFDGVVWNDELALSRYELLWEAGLVPEASSHRVSLIPGKTMRHDYRRVLATALSRIRAKIRYTPVVFDLLPPSFPLLQLQNTMEALAGRLMHKQNFRRLVQQQGLVAETAHYIAYGKGRPARLYSFQSEIAPSCFLAGAMLPLPSL